MPTMSYVNRVSQNMLHIHQMCSDVLHGDSTQSLRKKIWLILTEIQIFKGMRVHSHDKTKRDIFGIECEIYASFKTLESSQKISHFTVAATLL